jgi:predicted DNA-binding protein
MRGEMATPRNPAQAGSQEATCKTGNHALYVIGGTYMTTKMQRINFHLPDDLLERLEAYCAHYGAVKSEVIRRALDKYLAEVEKPAAASERQE